jgi:uroporphyrinogen III methyltransferase/synthase
MTVFLVGAGPGDPGLMTARALELLRTADVVLYDRLIPPGVLDGLAAELVYVGKVGGGEQMPQEEIDGLLVEHGRTGKRVVRLKGGDPFVFGRGGEEALVLREAGIDFEVVPGVTAGIAAPAYAGIPVTHRGLASGVAFFTGHETELDYPALAAFPGTLVFYMGVRALPAIAAGLVGAGRPADQAVAIVERGTLSGQRTTLATLGTIDQVTGVRAPAITLVGDVAGLREQLAWLESRPLHGRTIAVTRAREQSSPLAERLRNLGAEVIEAPTIRTRPLDAALPGLAAYDLVCVTSPNGAHRLFDLVRDARDLVGPRIATVGPGTAAALAAHGIAADIVPSRSTAEGLVEALAGMPVARALIVRAREGREVLPDALRERGAQVDVLPVYETVAEPLSQEAKEAAAGSDYLTFTSGSTVRHFVDAGGDLGRARVVSIGPATSDVLRSFGREPDLEADPHTPDGLVDVILRDCA